MMLRLPLCRPGRVYSGDQLLARVHDNHRDISDRAIETHSKNLRKKVQSVDPAREGWPRWTALLTALTCRPDDNQLACQPIT